MKLGFLLSLLLVAAWACLSERPRPGPPLLTLSLAKLSVRSPDTLVGTLRANDPDGVDSVWLTVDAATEGWNASFAVEFNTGFRAPIRRAHNPGDRLPITLRARDVAGFQGQLDTVVTVGP